MQNYYNKRKLAQDSQALRKKKGTGSSNKKSDADYELLAEEEIFHGRYKVNGKRLGMVRSIACLRATNEHPRARVSRRGAAGANCRRVRSWLLLRRDRSAKSWRRTTCRLDKMWRSRL